jgi:hypothetical protein
VALTKVVPNIIAVANNVTNKTVGNTTSIPSFTFDGAGVVTSASNVAISGAGITANTVANSAFQTGSVESYLRGANLDFGMRNRIINGAMVIDQRNAGASVTATTAGLYTLDRWVTTASQNSKFSVQQNAGSITPPAGFTNYLGATSLSAYSVGSTENFEIQQRIEGFNTADLGWGTANAKTVTLSFQVYSSLTGTFGGFICNAATNYSYVFSYSIPVANTWTQISVTIAGPTAGTWLGATNGVGVWLGFSLGAGSTTVTTAGSWNASLYRGVSGQQQVVGTNGATWYITGVQLEVGTQATSFEYRQYGNELQLCQRYYNKMNLQTYTGFVGWADSTTEFIAMVSFPVTMRTDATFTSTGAGAVLVIRKGAGAPATLNTTDLYATSAGNCTARLFATVSSGLTAGHSGAIAVQDGYTAYMAWSAEL